MPTLDTSRSLAELVLERPLLAPTLARFGLDYCCGGERSLVGACAERGLHAPTVAVLLASEPEPAAGEATDWASASPAALCAHVVEVHHARLRWDLPRLSELAERAALRHGRDHPSLVELRDELALLRSELERHIDREERELFPALAAGRTPGRNEVERIRTEHELVGARLRRLRALAGGYGGDAAPLCTVHRTLLQGLHGLELDLHQHVHEESNILLREGTARPG